MRKLEQVLAIVEADRQLSAQTHLLGEWKCGDITVAVDASRRVIVCANEPQAVVGDVAAFISALASAKRFADEARKARSQEGPQPGRPTQPAGHRLRQAAPLGGQRRLDSS